MKYTVIEDNLENIARYRNDRNGAICWPSIFMLPEWLETWWRFFGNGAEPVILTVLRRGEVIGIAPLARRNGCLTFVGSPDLCDYMDFASVPGAGGELLGAILDYLSGELPQNLELQSLRPDSVVLDSLPAEAGKRGLNFQSELSALSLEMDLPRGWEEYLAGLNKKQRHEVRRKLRRLHEAGAARYFAVTGRDAVREYLPLFFDLFVRSRQDKAAFMNRDVEQFFRTVVEALAGQGLVRLGILELNGEPVAMVLLFDYHDTIYLYNSCYDPRFRWLSVGLLCKVFSIKDAIAHRKSRYDFLKGGEPYKHRLGGREVPLFNCRLLLDVEN